MILYDATIPASYLEYGIQIPVRDSRASKTFEFLKHHPHLGRAVERWHIDRIAGRVTRHDLLRAHTRAYVDDLFSPRLEKRIASAYELIDAQGDFNRFDPASAIRPLGDLFQRVLLKAGGTVQCAEAALAHGFCFYLAGGTHHAYADHGSGFCLINDVVVAVRKLQAEKGVQTVWVIDTDAHKGDGTASITAADDTIVTLSIHMAHGWPLDGSPILPDGTPNPAHTPSNIDIPIESGSESHYAEKLRDGLEKLKSFSPANLAIIVSGADPYEKDELPSAGLLNLTLEQLLQRDQMVYRFLKQERIPAAFLMAGGYGDHVWEVFARFLTWALTAEGFGDQFVLDPDPGDSL